LFTIIQLNLIAPFFKVFVAIRYGVGYGQWSKSQISKITNLELNILQIGVI